jgi:uncharacterized membrane protein
MAMSPVFEVGVIAFADTESADRVVDGLRQMGATDLVNDVSLIEHHKDGRFSVHAYSRETSRGSKIGAGAVIGTLAGALLLGPFGMVVGLVGGGAVGASLGGRNSHDLGLSDSFVEELGRPDRRRARPGRRDDGPRPQERRSRRQGAP